MKFLIQVVIIAVLGYILELFFPWYCIAIAAFIGGLLNSKANFLAGFLAIGLLWFLKAWIVDSESSSPLADNVAVLLMVKQKTLLFLAMILIGGLIGGFAAMAGSALRKEKRTGYY